MLALVTLIPGDEFITYEIKGSIICTSSYMSIPNTGKIHIEAQIWDEVFRSKEDLLHFLWKCHPVIAIIDHRKLGYDKCDVIR